MFQLSDDFKNGYSDEMVEEDDKCVANLVRTIDTFIADVQANIGHERFENSKMSLENSSPIIRCTHSQTLVENHQDNQNITNHSLDTNDQQIILNERYQSNSENEQLVGKHSYNDFAEPRSIEKVFSCDEKVKLELNMKIFQMPSLKKSIPKKRIPFPKALHRLLEDAIEKNYSDIIRWDDNGRSFKVQDTTRFVSQILPQYFKQSHYRSFQRQLGFYGFLRVTKKEKDGGSYYHERFLRGDSLLAGTIRRISAKGPQIPCMPSTDTEPNFNEMYPVGDVQRLMTTSESLDKTMDSLSESSLDAYKTDNDDWSE